MSTFQYFIVSKMREHASFLVMLGAAFCMFAINVIGKNNLSPEAYSQMAMDLIFLGYLGTLSFLGADSVFIRKSKVDAVGKIQCSRELFVSMGVSCIAAWVVFPILGVSFIDLGGASISSVWKYILLSFLVPFFMIVSTMLRLCGDFIAAQIILNLWKPIFLCALLYCVLFNEIQSEIGGLIIAALFIGAVVACGLFYKRVDIEVDRCSDSLKGMFQLQYSYLLSFVFFAALGSVDRVVLSGSVEPAQFAEYIYMVVILVFPINMISNYFGYKELVRVKQGYVLEAFEKSTKLIPLALCLYLVYSLLIYFLKDLIGLELNFYVWVSALVIVVCKMPYSMFSAIMGGVGNSTDINNANYISLISLAIGALLIYLLADLQYSLLVVAGLWIIRVFLYYEKSKKYIVNR